MTADELVDRIRRDIRESADPSRAPGMQAYMKSLMPYAGTGVPVVRRLTHAAARGAERDVLLAASATLWDEAVVREERYAAAALLSLPPVRGHLDLLPRLEHMVVSGAWWDHVDELAHRVGELLRAHPAELGPRLRAWATGPNLWLRRVSIICQLDLGRATDLDLLSFAILNNAEDREFFLRKAIGWALRQYARTDPDWVRGFLNAHADRLSPLSRREAAKHL